MNTKCNSVLVLVLYYAAVVATEDIKMIIPLNKTLTYYDREIYGCDITLNGSSTLEVNFSDVNKNISFIIFQAHTHIHEITMMYNNNSNKNASISGTNVGLISFTDPKLDMFTVKNSNVNVSVSIYISVQGYTEKDPIPGGCNLDFDVPIAPYLRTTFDSDYVTVDASAPSTTKLCGRVVPNTTFYMMYLPEMSFDSDVYFDGIKKMMSIKNIEQNGWVIPQYSSLNVMRRLLGAYPTMGTVYVVVAHNNNGGYAVYVPSVTYACTPFDDNGCELLDDFVSKMLCAVLFFIGIFICYLGHRFFKTEMFLSGFFTGVIITYILISLITLIDRPALLAASILSGAFFGAIWLLFWWLYSVPLLAVWLPSLHLGFLLAAIFYYRLPAVHLLMDTNLNFWCTFILIMVLTSMALVSVSYATNILCCSVLGAYAAVYAFDYCIGSNLKYIIVNTVRRASVPKFKSVTLAPPFQLRDAIMVLLWIVLAASGFVFQHYQNRGRPPFPPPPKNTRLSVPEDRMYGTIPDQDSRRQRNENIETADERTALLS